MPAMGLHIVRTGGCNMNRFKKLASYAAIAVLALSGQEALSQGVTGKTVRIVVPFPAGGPADVLARLLAEQIGRAQVRTTMVIEDRPGASSAIGTEAVSRAMPDGNTLLFVGNNFVINASVRPSLSYHPLTSFEPICLLANLPLLLVVNSSSEFHSLAEFLAAARARPGELILASFGPGTPPHIAEESLRRAAGVDWSYVPYPAGDAPAVTALLGEHVTAVLATYSGVIEQVASGKLRPLAVAERVRIAPLPDVPTIVESGYAGFAESRHKDFEASGWLGVVAPAKTPKETIAHLSALFASALQAPEVKSKLLPQGLYPVGTCGADFAAYIRTQHDEYARIIREANIKAE
jgi:tripartite-type tricarboxylate transporter receptor subunit TctC